MKATNRVSIRKRPETKKSQPAKEHNKTIERSACNRGTEDVRTIGTRGAREIKYGEKRRRKVNEGLSVPTLLRTALVRRSEMHRNRQLARGAKERSEGERKFCRSTGAGAQNTAQSNPEHALYRRRAGGREREREWSWLSIHIIVFRF
jgi:hypothetical protein